VFKACLASQRHDNEVQKSLVEGQALGVNGTPTFFINGVRHNGGYDLKSLLGALRSAG